MNEKEFQKYRFEHSLKMMQTPNEWPIYPVLPLVRRKQSGLPDTAFMASFGGNTRPTIYLGNIAEIPTGFLTRRDFEDRFEVERFEDFEGVLDAGWEVD